MKAELLASFRVAATARSFVVAFALAGCTAPSGGAEPACAETVLPPCATGPDRYSDEACLAYDDALARGAVRIDPSRAPILESPADDATLDGATPPMFRWRGQLSARAPSPRGERTLARREATVREELAKLLDPLPLAHAHCLPYTGLGYSLAFRVGGRVVLRVQGSTTEYTPTPAAWAALRDAGGPVELTVTATRFRESAVDEGPFAPAAPLRFRIR